LTSEKKLLVEVKEVEPLYQKGATCSRIMQLNKIEIQLQLHRQEA
jgi:hypothetical protein